MVVIVDQVSGGQLGRLGPDQRSAAPEATHQACQHGEACGVSPTGHDTSSRSSKQAPLTRMHVEPHVPGVPAPVGDDPADQTAPFSGLSEPPNRSLFGLWAISPQLSDTLRRMSWLLPTPPLLLAGVMALLPQAFLPGRSISLRRLLGEVFADMLPVIRVFSDGCPLPD